MSPMKRIHDDIDMAEVETAFTSPFLPMFELFKNELDQHQERRERIIKASRDVTALSKKMIFSLQRVRPLDVAIPPRIVLEVQERSMAIQKLFKDISKDLQVTNAWRYQKQVSPGIQEFVEAISFEYYLRNRSLITIDEASGTLPGDVILTGDDYVLGIFDLIGELMRFTITTMATSASLPSSGKDGSSMESSILDDLRLLRAYFEALECDQIGPGKDVEKKMEVMKTCVEKVETAMYSMIIRGQERSKGRLPDLGDDTATISGD